jgi:hypothetical protein
LNAKLLQRKQIIGKVFDYVLKEDLCPGKIPLVRLLLKRCPTDLATGQDKQVIEKIVAYVHCLSVQKKFLVEDVLAEFLLLDCPILGTDQRDEIIELIVNDALEGHTASARFLWVENIIGLTKNQRTKLADRYFRDTPISLELHLHE